MQGVTPEKTSRHQLRPFGCRTAAGGGGGRWDRVSVACLYYGKPSGGRVARADPLGLPDASCPAAGRGACDSAWGCYGRKCPATSGGLRRGSGD
jgi:hypothetical protein